MSLSKEEKRKRSYESVKRCKENYKKNNIDTVIGSVILIDCIPKPFKQEFKAWCKEHQYTYAAGLQVLFYNRKEHITDNTDSIDDYLDPFD